MNRNPTMVLKELYQYKHCQLGLKRTEIIPNEKRPWDIQLCGKKKETGKATH